MKKILTMLLLTFTIGSVSAFAENASSVDYVNFRTGPGMDERIEFVVTPGTEVTIISEFGFWSKVQIGEKVGYMATEYLAKNADISTPDFAVTTSALNLRTSGSLSATILTVIPNNTAIKIIGDSSQPWVNVKYGTKTGWVYSGYINVGGAAVVTPTPIPTPIENEDNVTGDTYKLAGPTKIYMNAGDAAKKISSVGSYSAGQFYIFRIYSGMINITRTAGSPGAWINPLDESSNETESETPIVKPIEVGVGSEKKTFYLSFYSVLPEENGGYDLTASGESIHGLYGVAASNYYPMGTRIYLEGWGEVRIADRGGSDFNSSSRLDLLIQPLPGESTSDYKDRILEYGRQTVSGYVIK